jgi:hypothetical protein
VTLSTGAGYVALFTEDGVLDGEKGEHRGRHALAAAVGPVWASEGAASVHLTCNAVIDPEPGPTERAIATSTLVVVDPGPPAMIRSVSVIIQQVVKIGPDWRIVRRTVTSP